VRASVGTGGFAAYAATKGAIEAFTRAMAHEFGPHGVTVAVMVFLAAQEAHYLTGQCPSPTAAG
jgi:short-subunit dehydrogenase